MGARPLKPALLRSPSFFSLPLSLSLLLFSRSLSLPRSRAQGTGGMPSNTLRATYPTHHDSSVIKLITDSIRGRTYDLLRDSSTALLAFGILIRHEDTFDVIFAEPRS